MAVYSHAILWLFPKAKNCIRIPPVGRERLKGLGLLAVLRCDFLKDLMAVPVLSIATVPVLQECRQ